jgi:hypothetical protein
VTHYDKLNEQFMEGFVSNSHCSNPSDYTHTKKKEATRQFSVLYAVRALRHEGEGSLRTAFKVPSKILLLYLSERRY